jgi:hypothetical protein
LQARHVTKARNRKYVAQKAAAGDLTLYQGRHGFGDLVEQGFYQEGVTVTWFQSSTLPTMPVSQSPVAGYRTNIAH